MNNVLVVLLSHQPPDQVLRTIELWSPVVAAESLLLAYGGAASVFPQIDFEQKVFIDDPRLRLRDQQREQQSWVGVLHAAREFLSQNPRFDYIYLVEYDHVPVVGDLVQRMVARLEAERADALAHHLHRIDGTSNAHYLYHANERWFHEYFTALSKRSNTNVILSMLGTGSFWRREAFEDVSARTEPFPMYVELFLPSLAHHLGYRIRDIPDQNPFVLHLGDRGAEIEDARAKGAWTLHPVKTLPTQPETTLL